MKSKRGEKKGGDDRGGSLISGGEIRFTLIGFVAAHVDQKLTIKEKRNSTKQKNNGEKLVQTVLEDSLSEIHEENIRK